MTSQERIVSVKRLNLAFGCMVFVGAALLGGCAGPAVSPPGGVYPDRSAAVLTMAHYVPGPVRTYRAKSWMMPRKKTSILMYVGDWSTNDVFVYDYRGGEQVGQLTGFDEPYGMCVDKKGDVYVANFGAGDAVEYAHGGTKVLNTYDSGGSPIGCAVFKNGDLAVTSFDPGEITVYTGGNPSKGKTYSDSSCPYEWTAGYDGNGDVIGEYESSTFCVLFAGDSSETTLTGSGISISFPGGTTWDGKYLVLGDQEANGKYQTGLVRATLTRSGLTESGETYLSDDCYSNYVDLVNPFVVGRGITPGIDRRQGRAIAGPNLWCYDAGAAKVDYWHYTGGGLPFKTLPDPPAEPYGAAVSYGDVTQ
jgi:hypothetical protein